jgi:cytoskeletal protein CcmA (bactofilin family)
MFKNITTLPQAFTRNRLNRLLRGILFSLIWPLTATSVTLADTVTVTTTADAGAGSLREAITLANSTAGSDTIEFDIPGAGPHTISPTSSLPIIIDPVVIDGTTQPGADCSSWPPTLLIELDGRNATFTNGLQLDTGSDGSTIRGLVINRFEIDGVNINTSNGHFIECNFIGTDVSGLIGLGNGDDGIDVSESEGNTIGGITSGKGNLISANLEDGISVTNDANNNLIQGNLIGTSVNGADALGNTRHGINILTNSSGNVIGGTANGAANTIAYNGSAGVLVQSDDSGSNAVLGNSIHSNGGLGIELSEAPDDNEPDGVTANDAGDGDAGPNGLQNFPVLTLAETNGSSSSTITGTFNSTPITSGFRLEFFANAVCNGDQSGNPHPTVDYGEGETFLGFTTVSTDGSGDASFSVNLSASVPAGAFITATATGPDPDNSTSEFSQCVETDLVSGVPHAFVFLADKKVTIQKPGDSEGGIHSNGSIVIRPGNSKTLAGNVTAVGDITIDKKNTIDGDVTAGGEVSNNGTVTGAINENAAVANQPLPSLSFSAGGDNITVAKGEFLSIGPDSYGHVKLGKNSTLELTAGEYFMQSFNTDGGERLVLDVSGGEIIINVVKELNFGVNSRVEITPGGESATESVTFNSLTPGTIKFKKGTTVLGTIVAPDALVSLEKAMRFKGAICAKEIKVAADVVYLPHGSNTALPKLSPDFEESEDAEELELTSLPLEYSLEQNYPNPFNPSTTIAFALPHASEVTLSIFNIRGQLVRSLIAGNLAAGHHSVVWDARDEHGTALASGIYVYQLKAKDFVQSRRLVLMK